MKPQGFQSFNRPDKKADKPTKMEKAFNAIEKEKKREAARKKAPAA